MYTCNSAATSSPKVASMTQKKRNRASSATYLGFTIVLTSWFEPRASPGTLNRRLEDHMRKVSEKTADMNIG